MPDIFLADEQKDDQKKEVTPKEEPFPHPLDFEPNPMFPLASFCVDPIGVSFANQGENEEIHLFLRKHFVTNVPWILFGIVLLVLPFVFPSVLPSIPFVSSFKPHILLILTIFYYIVVLGAFMFTSFINWFFNVYIVTNERVIDVDFVNILYREVSATRINLIQDVTVKTGGVFRAIFDYGDLLIQTAGAEVNFDFLAVPYPQEVAREIGKLMEAVRKKEGAPELEEALKK